MNRYIQVWKLVRLAGTEKEDPCTAELQWTCISLIELPLGSGQWLLFLLKQPRYIQ
jgi:hypothetical protein